MYVVVIAILITNIWAAYQHEQTKDNQDISRMAKTTFMNIVIAAVVSIVASLICRKFGWCCGGWFIITAYAVYSAYNMALNLDIIQCKTSHKVSDLKSDIATLSQNLSDLKAVTDNL